MRNEFIHPDARYDRGSIADNSSSWGGTGGVFRVVWRSLWPRRALSVSGLHGGIVEKAARAAGTEDVVLQPRAKWPVDEPCRPSACIPVRLQAATGFLSDNTQS